MWVLSRGLIVWRKTGKSGTDIGQYSDKASQTVKAHFNDCQVGRLDFLLFLEGVLPATPLRRHIRDKTADVSLFALQGRHLQYHITQYTKESHSPSHLLGHIDTMSEHRRGLYFNDDWTSWSSTPIPSAEQVPKFHRSLPGYEQTPLRELDDLAKEIGVRAIYLKDEGNRLGLPSFKILGASWGTFRAIAARLNLPLDLDLDTFRHALRGSNISLFAATDGNHGRAVARMGSWLGLRVKIHAPAAMNASTIRFIESEGATVVRSTGTYDDAVLEAQTASTRYGGILIQDFAFGDYEDIPQVSTRTMPDVRKPSS